MRRLSPYLLAFVVGLLSLSCERDAEDRQTADRRQVIDGLGRAVSMPAEIRRIVPLSPSVTEVVFAAGAGDLVVGVSLADDYPPGVIHLPRFNAYPLDLEAIVALDPDLVLASDQVNHPAQVSALEHLGIPAYFLESQDVADTPDIVRRVGGLLDRKVPADRTADSLEQRMALLKSATTGLANRPDVLVLAGAAPLYGFGTESYIHELVRLSGGRSVTAALQTSTPVLSDEFVLRSMPDVIVGTDSAVFTPEGILKLHPTWDVVPAIENRKVYALDPDLIYRPGPRLIEGAYQLAKLLHPQLSLPTAP